MFQQLVHAVCTNHGVGQATEEPSTAVVRAGMLQGIALAAVCWIIIKLLQRRLDALTGAGSTKVEPGPWAKPAPAPTNGHEVGAGEAAQFWSKGYGRYKYCGLREDPFASDDPPLYSTRDMDLPVPGDLSPKERERLHALRERVAGPLRGKHRTDLSTCLRFLRARQGNVEEAAKLLHEAAALRREHGLDDMFTDWNMKAYEECFAPWWLSGGFIGHGFRGEPIAVERIGHCNFPKLVETVPWDALVKMDIVHCQRALAAIEEDALRRNVPVLPSTLIFDVDGFGFNQIQFRAATKLRKLIDVRNLLLTETTGTLIMVRAPKAFVQAWRLFSYLLDPGTVAKVQVCSPEDTYRRLCEYVPKNVIPAYLGGEKHVGGDPECRKLLAPGGFPPQEAFDRLEALLAGRGDTVPSEASPGSAVQVPKESAGRVCGGGLGKERACCAIS
mmetsp:Transcript_128512/g.363702  ORF Transcript_128512/g.363702 Transcript_128512/m.363702 type:complete len:444 (-) Transcript_128512:101-1432(-)